MAMRKNKDQVSRRIRMSQFGRQQLERAFQNIERLSKEYPNEAKYNVKTNGQILLLAIQDVSNFELKHGVIDWFELSRLVAKDPQGADAVQKVPTSPVPFTVEPRVEAGIQSVKDATADDARFGWKRSGGVYVGYAVMLIITAFNLLQENRGDDIPRTAN